MNVTPLGGGDCCLNGQVCKSATIDWTLRDGARAKMRVMVKRILNKYDYWLPRCRRSVGLRPVLRRACLSRNDAEPLTTDFTDDTDAKHLDEGPETVKKVHHLVSNPPAGIVLKFL